MNWHEYFFNMVEVIKLRSKDSETKVGAVIVDKDNRIISTGYNSFPAGCDDKNLPSTRPKKYPFMVHAEINALLYAHSSLEGSSIYCNWSPCIDCSKAIITAKVKKIRFSQKYSGFDEDVVKLFEVCGYSLRQEGSWFLLEKEEVKEAVIQSYTDFSSYDCF